MTEQILDRIAAEYALTRFDQIRDGWDPFDWFENLEEGEIQSNAQDGRDDAEMDPEAVFYGPVTEAPPVGEKTAGDAQRGCSTQSIS